MEDKKSLSDMKTKWAPKKAPHLKSQYKLVWKTLNAEIPK
jgi:hypothetical protein